MHNKDRYGSFTISLDFELYWGMRDVVSLERYKEHLLGVWQAVPAMLVLFEKYGIHTTWATVGFLWHENVASLKAAYPDRLPEYEDKHLSPYVYLASHEKEGWATPKGIHFDKASGSIGGEGGAKAPDSSVSVSSETFNKMHFAKELIEKIKATSHQEIATHTYSHYYTREPRIVPEAFDADLRQAVKIAEEDGVMVSSLVFPRNQIDIQSLEALKKNGIGVYRGNPEHWAYREGETGKTFWQRVYRFADIYMNLSGAHTTLPRKDAAGLVETKSSMFLRPYSQRFAMLENLKLKRVKNAMQEAAQKGENFHLWWHPHNFGVHLEENLANLEAILRHYHELNKEYGMLSLTMQELGEQYV